MWDFGELCFWVSVWIGFFFVAKLILPPKWGGFEKSAWYERKRL